MDKAHYSPSPKVRKERQRELEQQFHPIYKMAVANGKEFKRIEDLLDEITVDVINGVPRTDIIFKCTQGEYESQPKGVTIPTAAEYYRAVMKRLEVDEPQKDEARKVIYGMYLNLYRENMELGDRIGARTTLDSMVKLLGLANASQPQVNITADQPIKVTFGFKDGD